MSDARLPNPTPDELSPEQRALYDEIAGGPRSAGPRLFELVDQAGRLNGPFGIMLHSPAVGSALQALGAAVRYRSVLPDRIRELAVLAVAAHWTSEFELYAHVHAGDQPVDLRLGQPGVPGATRSASRAWSN